MKKVYDILKEISSTTKKNEKESILLEHKDHSDLRECFRLAYSPTINYWMKQPLTGWEHSDKMNTQWSEVFNTLGSISSRKYTGQEAKDTMITCLNQVDYRISEVVSNILQGDLRCGVGIATINKVWKNLIVKPPRQGAKSMSEASLKALDGKRLAVELKSDGSYMAFSDNLMSRNGNPIECPSLEEHLCCGSFDGYALEGEGIFDLTKATREEGNGIVGKIIKGTASTEDEGGLIYQVWDCIESSSYEPKGKYGVCNSVRRSILELMFEDYCDWCIAARKEPRIQLIPRKEYVTLAEAKEVFEGYVEQGFEGAILKDMDAGWSDNGKPSCCVKLKRKDNADLLVTGIYEGEGKAKGSLGGFNLESQEGTIKVNCGSGFSDDQRHLYFNNPNLILGKIVEVEYDSVTEDKKTLQKSLFLPIYKNLRNDKLEADTYEEILAKVKIKTK